MKLKSGSLAFLLSIVMTTGAALAQDARLRIDHLEALARKAAETTDVTLDGPLLQLAVKLIPKDENLAAVRSLVAGLRGVYVRSYEFDSDGAYSDADVETIRTQLTGPGWVRIVGVHSTHGRETTDVFLMPQGDNLGGLAVLVAEPRELTVVNIVGPIDLSKLGAIEGEFGVPKLGVDWSDVVKWRTHRKELK
jgi:hypothetical protein